MDDWGEVVTREPYRKVRLDHLLSRVELAEDADGYEVDSIARCYKQRERVTEKLFTVQFSGSCP